MLHAALKKNIDMIIASFYSRLLMNFDTNDIIDRFQALPKTIVMLKLRQHIASRRIQDLMGLFHVFTL